MSKTIDERVVEMRFDNRNFESNVKTSMSTLDKLKQSLNFKGASKGLEELNSASKKVDMSTLGNGIEHVKAKFSALQVMGVTALANITNSAVNAGKRIVSALTIEPVKTGFNEYELKMDSVRTIMASTGESVETVSRYLEELNKYSDETIYSFSDMTQNIGKFTNAGVKLEDAVNAIKGISNEAAVSGANANEASRAMYNFAQALSAGYVKLIDWKSIENANMATLEFKQQLINTAVEMGTLTKTTDGMYKTGKITMNATRNFNDSLKNQWMTSEVLITTLGKYSDKQTEIGKKASEAAQEVNTVSKMWDVLKETAQSGWARTWEIIVGDIEEAKAVLTPLSETISNIIQKFSDARNKVLEGALGKSFSGLSEKIKSILTPVNKATKTIKTITKATKDYSKVVNKIINGEFGNGETRIKKLTEAGYDWAHAQNLVNEKLGISVHHATKYKESKDAATKSDKKAIEAKSELSKEDTKLIEKLTELSDAELKAAGYTDKQIVAFRELKAQADKVGMSISDFVENIDKIDGRWLIIDSFKNIGKAIGDVLKQIKEAWRDVFHNGASDDKIAEERAQKLYDFIAKIHSITEKLIANEDSLNKVGDIFRGMFSGVDILRRIGKGLFGSTFSMIVTVLKALNINGKDILEFIASLADKLTVLNNWIKENDIITNVITTITQSIAGAIIWIKMLIEHLTKLPGASKGIETVKSIFEFLSGIIEKINGKLKTFGKHLKKFSSKDLTDEQKLKLFKKDLEKITSIFEKIKNIDFKGLFSGIWTDITSGFKNRGENDFLKTIENIASKIKKRLEKVFEILFPKKKNNNKISPNTGNQNALESISTKISDFKNNLETFYNFVVGKAKPIFDWLKDKLPAIISITMGIFMIQTIRKLGGALDTLAAPFANITGAFKKMANSVENIAKSVKFKMVAEGIKSIAIALAILIGAIAGLALLPDHGKLWSAVGAVAVLIVLLGGLSFAISKIENLGDVGKLGLASLSFLSLAASLLIIVGCLKLMEDLDYKTAWKNAALLGAMTVALVGIVVAMSYLSKDFNTGAITFIALAGGLWILADALVKLDIANLENAKRNLGFMLGLVAILGLLAKAFSKLSFGSAVGIIAISVGLLLFLKAVEKITAIDSNKIKNSLVSLITIFGLFSMLLIASKFAGKNSLKAGVGILAMSLSLMIIAQAIDKIGKMDESTIQNGIKVITKIFIVFGAVIALSYFAGKNAIKAGLMLLLMSGALLVLVGVIAVLTQIAKYNPEELKEATAIISILMGVMSGVIAVTKLAQDCKGTLIILTAVIVLLSTALIALTVLAKDSPDGLSKATAALTSVIGSFALLIASTKLLNISDTKKTIGTLLTLTVFVGLIGGLLVSLSQVNPGPTLEIAASISLVLLSIAGACFILNFVSPIAAEAMHGMLILGGIAAMLGILLTVLSQNDPGPTLEIAASLSLLILSLSGALVLLGYVGTFGPAAFVGLGALAVLIVGLAAIITALGALVTEIPQIQDFVDNGLPLLEKLGYGLGSFIGGFGAGLIDGLSSVGTSLSDFMTNMQGFFDSIKNVPVTDLESIKTLAEIILILSGASILDGIGKFISGSNSLDTFGSQLETFGKSLVNFSNTVKGKIDEEAVTAAANAGKVMAELAGDIPRTGPSVASFFAGNNGLDTFGERLVIFGEAIVKFSNTVTGEGKINEEAVTAAANAGYIMTALAKDVPRTGPSVASFFAGNNGLDTFGERLVIFGEAIVKFSNTVTGEGKINEEAVTAAANAGKVMAELAGDIPRSGKSVTSFFSGDNGLDKFGERLVIFGEALIGFSNTVSKGDLNSDSISSACSASTKLVDLANYMKGVDFGVFKDFASGVKKLGKVSAQDFVNGFKKESVNSAVKACESLISGLAKVLKPDTSNFRGSGKKIGSDFSEGIKDKKSDAESAGKTLGDKAKNGAKDKEDDMEAAGKDLGEGLIRGINAKKPDVYAAAFALGQAAVRGEKNGQESKSPSKATKRAGKWFGEGLIIGINSMGSKVYKAGYNAGNTAVRAISNAISVVSDIIDSDMDTQPTIRPVLDLSDVRAGAGSIGGIFGKNPAIDILANAGSVSLMMNRRNQNGSTDDVVSAIRDLNNSIKNSSGDTYNVNGITYDDGSEVSNAIQTLIRAARIERRV